MKSASFRHGEMTTKDRGSMGDVMMLAFFSNILPLLAQESEQKHSIYEVSPNCCHSVDI